MFQVDRGVGEACEGWWQQRFLQAVGLGILLCVVVFVLLPWQAGGKVAAQTRTEAGLAVCDMVQEIPRAECEALEALYTATDGPNWFVGEGWLQTTTPCEWHGVNCLNGAVIGLELADNQLVGEIPTELTQLSALETLDLSLNQLVGPIPAELGAEQGGLHQLKTLRLYSNGLTGPLPPALVNIETLEILDVGNNQLTGTIPALYGGFQNLTILDLSSNLLEGTIPTELGEITPLRRLNLSDNRLTGTIPGSLGGFPNLTILNVAHNQLQGAIPLTLGSLPLLQELNLANNMLTGTIPPQFDGLTSLRRLNLSVNRLGGEIPEVLGNLTGLLFLDLSYNALSGEIPASIANLTNLSAQNTNFGYNALEATDENLRLFLAEVDADWAQTQTVPPFPTVMPVGRVQVPQQGGGVRFDWTPISYTQDGGYYTLRIVPASGPAVVYGQTEDKTATGITLLGLAPSQPFSFTVQTFTPAHGLQQNDLWSRSITRNSEAGACATTNPNDLDCVSPVTVADIGLVAERWAHIAVAGDRRDRDQDGILTILDIMTVADAWGAE